MTYGVYKKSLRKITASGLVAISLFVSGCVKGQNSQHPQADSNIQLAKKSVKIGLQQQETRVANWKHSHLNPDEGKATFVSKTGELIIKSMGYKPQWRTGGLFGDDSLFNWDDGVFVRTIINWDDGVRTAYTFGTVHETRNRALIREYKGKDKGWSIVDRDASWKSEGENVVIKSANGNKTILGGFSLQLQKNIENQENQKIARLAKEREKKERLSKMTLEDWYVAVSTKACRKLETSKYLNNKTFGQSIQEAVNEIEASDKINQQVRSLNQQVVANKLESYMNWECNHAMQVLAETRMNEALFWGRILSN